MRRDGFHAAYDNNPLLKQRNSNSNLGTPPANIFMFLCAPVTQSGIARVGPGHLEALLEALRHTDPRPRVGRDVDPVAVRAAAKVCYGRVARACAEGGSGAGRLIQKYSVLH